MQALKFVLLPLLALSPSLLSPAFADSPIFTQCFDSAGNFSESDPYVQALQELGTKFINSLEYQPVGFTIDTAGNEDGTGEFVIFGLALCRGDVSPHICNTCVAEATNYLRNTCRNRKEAITWYDKCMVRYAARNYYGDLEGGKFCRGSYELATDRAAFNQKVVNLLKRVSSEAYGNEARLFGTEEADVVVDGKKQTIYSLAQCTRDITAKKCQTCLLDLMKDFPRAFDGRKGGRALSSSCNFRYELYRFY